jgi:hypothetical protein
MARSNLDKKLESKTISLLRVLYKKLSAKKSTALVPKFNKDQILFYYDSHEAQLIWQFVRTNKYYIDLWSLYVDAEDNREKAEIKNAISNRFLLKSPVSPLEWIPNVVFQYSPIKIAQPNNPGFVFNEICSLELATFALNKLGIHFTSFNKFPKGFYQFRNIEFLIKYSASHLLKEELGKTPDDKYMAWAINEKILGIKKYKRINSSQLASFKESFQKISSKAPFIFFVNP